MTLIAIVLIPATLKSTMRFAPLNVPLHRRIETAVIFLHVFNMFVIHVFSFLLPLILIFTRFYPLVIAYFIFLYYDWDTPAKGSRPSEWVRNWTFWKRFANYFPVKIVKTAEISPEHNYIFGSHPHGVISCGINAAVGTEGAGFSKTFPGIIPSLCTLNMNFLTPVMRLLITSLGYISVAKESIEYQLKRDTHGRAVVIVLGGAEEALDAHHDNFTLTLKSRKGFVKLALENGAHLVPVFSFGENDVYTQIRNERGSWIRTVQTKIKEILGFSPVLFLGRGIFNYSFGLLPYRKPINIVFGAPISVEKVEDPTREQVQELHEKYCEALTKLFDDNKTVYGISEDKKLTIV
ncbi:hypothetical protein L596_020053 [Steinernema carpocapsae]|uniref:Acyltransferase n=2 Tax=Steinernema carpocapsae TaxID=34508 RepID=A0A4U5MSE1_STECR|nr:hypothetical protein L596_020053 [Steinernema carpocapsae]